MKSRNYIRDRYLMRSWIKRHSGKIFLVPLQVYNDSQMLVHSKYQNVEAFIDEVIENFSKRSDTDSVLLIKHHPMDRGFTDYTSHIKKKAVECGVTGRVVYGSEFHLPSIYHHLKGCVVVNSTVGISALHHKVPTICMGKSIYDLEGLTHQQDLSAFWSNPAPVTPGSVQVLESRIKRSSQVWGSFYRFQNILASAIVRRLQSLSN